MPKRRIKTPAAVQERICQALRLGATVEVACTFAGISPKTYHEWMQRAEGTHKRKSTKAHADFAEAIKSAMSGGEMSLLARIQQASQDPKYWTAAAWLLERRNPDRWGRVDRNKIEGTKPLKVVFQFSDDEETIASDPLYDPKLTPKKG